MEPISILTMIGISLATQKVVDMVPQARKFVYENTIKDAASLAVGGLLEQMKDAQQKGVEAGVRNVLAELGIEKKASKSA